jgi:replicative DNA helicase
MISDPDAERAVLGCVLAGEKPSSTGLTSDAFTEARVHVWEAMAALESEGLAIDHLTLAERLKARGRLAQVGGPAELMALDQGVPHVHNLASYVAILRGMAERRAIIAACERGKAAAEDLSADPRRTSLTTVQALTGASHLVREEAPDVDIEELATQWSAWFERLERGQTDGLDDGLLLKTGIDVLDNACEGLPSNLCCLLGLASMGKTALAAEIIWNWLKAGVPGGIIGLEDGTKWLTRRHLARHLGIPVAKVGRTLLHDHQMARLTPWMDVTRDMYRKHLRIHRAGGLDAADLIAVVTRWISKGARWIWIDHGLRVRYDAGDGRRYDLAIGKTLEALATLGERHGVVIAVNWHLNRTSEQNSKPTISMAKESGYLEAAARWMVAVWEQPTRPGMVLATGLKVTEGPRDWTVALERDPEAALVKSMGGYPVDFAREANEERERAAEAKRLNTRRFKIGLASSGDE